MLRRTVGRGWGKGEEAYLSTVGNNDELVGAFGFSLFCIEKAGLSFQRSGQGEGREVEGRERGLWGTEGVCVLWLTQRLFFLQ